MTDALLVLLFALADRLAGGDYCRDASRWMFARTASWPPSVTGPLMRVVNMRSVAWATLWLALLLWPLGLHLEDVHGHPFGPKLSLLALGFAGWRWDGWKAVGGNGINPKSAEDFLLYAVREGFAVAFLPVFWALGLSIPMGLLAVAAFALLAAMLGLLLEEEARRGRDINAWIELARGAVLGVCVLGVLTT